MTPFLSCVDVFLLYMTFSIRRIASMYAIGTCALIISFLSISIVFAQDAVSGGGTTAAAPPPATEPAPPPAPPPPFPPVALAGRGAELARLRNITPGTVTASGVSPPNQLFPTDQAPQPPPLTSLRQPPSMPSTPGVGQVPLNVVPPPSAGAPQAPTAAWNEDVQAKVSNALREALRGSGMSDFDPNLVVQTIARQFSVDPARVQSIMDQMKMAMR